ncbi:MAG: hypothetical protein WGN25_10040 [Candidatus Electrothrix sp. GW3-4]|uniref:hypothetical protein n=1 Tax=Candidatus Electrothrix sp. GW3-4 TaxID=3126740 RepID=UPI0030CECAD2
MGVTRLELLKMPEAQRRAYEKYLINKAVKKDMLESAYERGFEEGIARGIREAGRAKGKLEVKREIAVKLLASGSLEIEAIAEVTGLSIEELQGLQ